MKLTPKKKVHPIVQLWRSLPKPKPAKKKGQDELQPSITQMRGNAKSKVLIIAPPCDPIEYSRQIPLSNMNAATFDAMLAEDIGFDTESCLVLSCSRWGDNPSKASTEAVRFFLRKSLRLKQFEFFICVGDEAFKHIFGRGKKPSMQSLAGNVMYVPETGFKPLFTFPSLDGLHVAPLPSQNPNEVKRMFDWSEKVNLRFQKLCQALKTNLLRYRLRSLLE